jgi:hypothetical protein
MPATEMIVMVAVIAAVALTLIHLFRLAASAAMHRTIRRMIERDPAIAESLLAQLVRPVGPGGDDRTAVLLIAFGVAMVIASLIVGDPSWMHYAIAGSVFPLVVGTALWLRHTVSARRRRAGSE